MLKSWYYSNHVNFYNLLKKALKFLNFSSFNMKIKQKLFIYRKNSYWLLGLFILLSHEYK